MTELLTDTAEDAVIPGRGVDVAVCCVAANIDHYVRGLFRVKASMDKWAPAARRFSWKGSLPAGSQPHSEMPYQFKSHALMAAKQAGFKKILWVDSCIVAVAPLDRIFDQAAEHGAWISDNGWKNNTWTSDESLPFLFPGVEAAKARELNEPIKHVVATAFAVDLDHPDGRAVFQEYYDLCQTPAICGPWKNGPALPGETRKNPTQGRCGGSDVNGHRHDQTILSLVAYRNGIPLTAPPSHFAYAPPHPLTVLCADGGHSVKF